ncbi:hypothetical protein ABW19_dt0209458 [Dactylella cylindrospora]|nr:hypothetical protein ABW19_dt0209458 [Dactylella cylindrospora]
MDEIYWDFTDINSYWYGRQISKDTITTRLPALKTIIIYITLTTLIVALPAYMVLFMDWKEMEHPFGPIREWMWEKVDSVWKSPAGQPLVRGSATASDSKGSSNSS